MERERENGKGILFGVLGIMTLIIAILGASLAYFTANSGSKKDAVEVQSATVTITYNEGDHINLKEESNLIPATEAVATAAYQRTDGNQCIDKNNKQVCAVYEFSVANNGDPLDIIGTITTTTNDSDVLAEKGIEAQKNEFYNLSYKVYDVGEQKFVSDKTAFGITGTSKNLFNIQDTETGEYSNSLTLGTGISKTYQLLIWLDDKDEPQNDEQGLRFSAQVKISVDADKDGQPDEGKITGDYTPATQE